MGVIARWRGRPILRGFRLSDLAWRLEESLLHNDVVVVPRALFLYGVWYVLVRRDTQDVSARLGRRDRVAALKARLDECGVAYTVTDAGGLR